MGGGRARETKLVWADEGISRSKYPLWRLASLSSSWGEEGGETKVVRGSHLRTTNPAGFFLWAICSRRLDKKKKGTTGLFAARPIWAASSCQSAACLHAYRLQFSANGQPAGRRTRAGAEAPSAKSLEPGTAL